MNVTLNVILVQRAIQNIRAELELSHDTLTVMDAKVGDGDLGITLLKAFRQLDQDKSTFPQDLGLAFVQAAGSVAKVSSSSFGTLLATGLMAAGKQLRGEVAVPWSALSGLLDAATEAMSRRGKAHLGDKTVLDALAAASIATKGHTDPQALHAAATDGVDRALAVFRGQPSRIGRARIFGDATIGLDDPGMVAFKIMLTALSGTAVSNP